MLVFAYDGTLNGDWVAHYVARLAAHAERAVRLVHVLGEVPRDELARRVAATEAELRRAGVTVEVELIERGRGGVAERLLEVAPRDPDALLVCGTRARPRNMAWLAGTVSARLLAEGRSAIVALRVAHPGVLGQPGRVLLPLAGHPRGAAYAAPLLRRLGPDLTHLDVLLVREVSRARFRTLTAQAAEALMAEGRAFVARVERELEEAIAPAPGVLDAHVVVSDDVPKEIVLFASKRKARLVCLGASERSTPRRLFYGDPIEQVLRDAPCDVAVYRGGRG